MNVQEIQERVDPILKGLFTIPNPPEKPKLIGNRCRECGEYYFPKRILCPNCHKDGTLEEAYLGPQGKLYTYCIVKVAPMGFDAPYGLGYVDLPEGVRIYSMICANDLEKLGIGMDMELVIDRLRDEENGHPIYGYKFKPLGEE